MIVRGFVSFHITPIIEWPKIYKWVTGLKKKQDEKKRIGMDKRHGFAGGFPNSDLLNLQGFHIMSHTSFHMKNQNEKERKASSSKKRIWLQRG